MYNTYVHTYNVNAIIIAIATIKNESITITPIERSLQYKRKSRYSNNHNRTPKDFSTYQRVSFCAIETEVMREEEHHRNEIEGR